MADGLLRCHRESAQSSARGRTGPVARPTIGAQLITRSTSFVPPRGAFTTPNEADVLEGHGPFRASRAAGAVQSFERMNSAETNSSTSSESTRASEMRLAPSFRNLLVLLKDAFAEQTLAAGVHLVQLVPNANRSAGRSSSNGPRAQTMAIVARYVCMEATIVQGLHSARCRTLLRVVLLARGDGLVLEGCGDSHCYPKFQALVGLLGGG